MLQPLRQESGDTCAIACLRMILAQHGMDVAEKLLEPQAGKQPGGVDIEDLRILAERLGFHAEIVQLDLNDIAPLLTQQTYPIVYLNRAHFLRGRFRRQRFLQAPIVHAVIPIIIGRRFITFNDPLSGTRRRILRKKFAAAQADLSHWCLVCFPK